VWRAPHLKNLELTRGGHLDLLFSARISSMIHRELASVEAAVAVRPLVRGDASFRPPATMNGERRPSLARRERAAA
jgi:hypothetical protein